VCETWLFSVYFNEPAGQENQGQEKSKVQDQGLVGKTCAGCLLPMFLYPLHPPTPTPPRLSRLQVLTLPCFHPAAS
jgi:hypothetical protein